MTLPPAFDPSRPVVFIDSHGAAFSAQIVVRDLRNEFPVLAVVTFPDGGQEALSFDSAGRGTEGRSDAFFLRNIEESQENPVERLLAQLLPSAQAAEDEGVYFTAGLVRRAVGLIRMLLAARDPQERHLELLRANNALVEEKRVAIALLRGIQAKLANNWSVDNLSAVEGEIEAYLATLSKS